MKRLIKYSVISLLLLYSSVNYGQSILEEYDSVRKSQNNHFITDLNFNSLQLDQLDSNLVNYKIFSLKHRRKVMNWQYHSSIIIFILVILIVITGLVLSYMHFRRNLNGDENSHTELEIGKSGLKVKSSIVGIIILVISVVFFYMYLAYIYEIKEIIPSTDTSYVLSIKD